MLSSHCVPIPLVEIDPVQPFISELQDRKARTDDQQGRYGEHGVARHGYAVDAPFIDTPAEARRHYSKRFGIETSYRLAQESLALTSSRDASLRYLLFVTSLLLQNVWRYVHWEFVTFSVDRGCY